MGTMGRRITNDEEILQLRREGKSSKEIAEHFGVSKQAINKRLQKLNPRPSLDHLTDKQRGFVQEVVKGNSHIDAAMSSHDVATRKDAATLGLALLNNPKITKSIEALLDYVGLTKEYRVHKLKGHVDNQDANVSLKALDMAFKLDSSYPPTKNLNLNVPVQFHPVDLSKYENRDETIEGEFTEQ
ncbi:MAG: helix-turn-helix transcriptional regulator [Syntrophobacteraceae bacterium]